MAGFKSWIGIGLTTLAVLIYLALPSPDNQLRAQVSEYGHIQSLNYRGFYCHRVQGDSRFDPANEMVLYLTVIGTEPDIDDAEDGPLYNRDFDFPFSHGLGQRTFRMLPGSYSPGVTKIWDGVAQNLFVIGAVVEIDGSILARGEAPFTAYQRYVDQLALPISNRRMQPDIANHRANLTKNLKNYFAFSEHDFAGADIYFIDGAEQPIDINWGETEETIDRMSSKQFTGEIDHHFRMRFSHGGADCYAFFYYSDAEKYGNWPTHKPLNPSDPLAIGNDHVCIAGDNRWHLTGNEVRRYRQNGTFARDGSNYTPRDGDCLFEFDIRSNLAAGGSYCVADRGKLRRNNSRGRSVGTCYQCSGEECEAAVRPQLISTSGLKTGSGDTDMVTIFESDSDLLCSADGKYFHMERGNGKVVGYRGESLTRQMIGRTFESNDRRCSYEISIYGSGGALCAKRDGELYQDNASGERVGRCLPCIGNACETPYDPS